MKIRSRRGLVFIARSLLAVSIASCSAPSNDPGGDAPAFTGAPNLGGQGSGSASTPGTPSSPGESPQSNGNGGEQPAANGETPLTGSEGEPVGVSPGAGPAPSGAPPVQTPRPAGGTPNSFSQLLGRSQAEVDAKVQTAVDRAFGIGTQDPATPTLNGGARLYYELPQDSSMAFIYAADSNDIRSEGMSYGMFIAVQMGMQAQFDRLWSFARRFMQYPPDTDLPAWRYYFRWTGTVDTSNAQSWTVSYNPTESPASDGEEYFAAALYLANRRWGSGGAVNYLQDAHNLANAMLNNPAGGARFPLIHEQENMVVFVPIGTANDFSDPSYHLPAFYELFAQDGPPADSARWLEIAEISRDYLVRSAHPTTGLHPDYATFDGAPTQGTTPSDHDDFRFDAWRVVMNMAIDYAWSGPDQRMGTQIDKYYAFFSNHLGNGNVANSLFNVDGSGASGGGSQALVATLASGALATNRENRMTFVNNLWNVQQPTGTFRYYQGSVYLLGLLATAGKFAYGFE